MSYIFAPEAEADVRDIAYYTSIKWCEAQSVRYIDALEEKLKKLAAGEAYSHEVKGHFSLPVRRAHCRHHYVFFLRPENAPIAIIVILHERSDYMRRLTARLRPRFISGGGNKI